MLAENGNQVDSEAVEDLLRRGDVITFGFSTFSQRLLVDTRSNADAGPLVAIVEPVTNVQDRYRWLGRHRGTFGAPEAFSFVMWPLTVRTLATTGVLETLFRRLAAVHASGPSQLEEALDSLRALERGAMRSAIRGEEPWKTVWARSQ